MVTAVDVGPTGKLDRLKTTEYKTDTALVEIIEASTDAWHNKGINFFAAVTSPASSVPAPAAPAAPVPAPAAPAAPVPAPTAHTPSP